MVSVDLNDKEALAAFQFIQDLKIITKVEKLREIFKESLENGVKKYTFVGYFHLNGSPEVASCTINVLDNPTETPRYKPDSIEAVM